MEINIAYLSYELRIQCHHNSKNLFNKKLSTELSFLLYSLLKNKKTAFFEVIPAEKNFSIF